MKKYLKYFLYLIVALLILMGGLAGVAYLMQDKIKQLVIAEVNQNVEVPIKVKGAIEFSVFSHFPNGALSFKKIEIEDRLRKNQQLLKVEEFSFLVDLWSLLKDEIKIHKIVIANGELNLYDKTEALNNYTIFKTKKSDTKGNLQLKIEEAQLKNVKLSYLSAPNNIDINCIAKDWKLKGKFSNEKFDLYTLGTIYVKKIEVARQLYLSEKEINATFLLNVNQTQSYFNVASASLNIGENEFVVSGDMQFGAKKAWVNLKAATQGNKIANLIDLIPLEFKEKLKAVSGKGKYNISATVKGAITQKLIPSINLNATFQDAEIYLAPKLSPLEKVNTSVNYHLDSLGNDHLYVNNFSSYLANEPFNCSLKINNLANPVFEFHANGIVNLTQLQAIIPAKDVTDLEGKIEFKRFSLQGSKADLQMGENSKLIAEGTFDLKQIKAIFQNVAYTNINGNIAASNRMVEAKNLTADFLNTSFVFNGQIADFLPYIYGFTNKDADKKSLKINGTIAVEKFDLSAMIKAFDKKNKTATKENKINIRDIFNFDGQIVLKVNEFHYNALLVKEILAHIRLFKGGLGIENLKCFAFDGEILQTGNIQFSPNNELILTNEIIAKKLSITKVFQNFENFDQTTLTDKNLKGEFNATINLKAVWDDYKTINLNKLLATMDCEIQHGELINYEPLKAASKYININDLNNIHFSDLKNQLSIKDGLITIPKMEVQSSLVNLFLEGTHSFENEINYNLKINLKKALASKFDRRGKDVQYIEDDPYDGLNLFLNIKGKLPNINFKYDKKGLKNQLKEEFKEEKEELKNLFKKGDYSKPKNENETKREEKYFDTKQPPTFIDFEEN